jgi:hypothetical protein
MSRGAIVYENVYRPKIKRNFETIGIFPIVRQKFPKYFDGYLELFAALVYFVVFRHIPRFLA